MKNTAIDSNATTEFIQNLFNLDDAILCVYGSYDSYLKDDPCGWIRLVFGNDGHNLISDYSTSLETFPKPVHELTKFWGV